MYGDDLLVAPVTEPDVDQWTVYLPGVDQVSYSTKYINIYFEKFSKQYYVQ